jgi:hypothetical protein
MKMFGKRQQKNLVSVPTSRDTAYPYMMECFLRSRTESGHPSNIDFYDEDVNVYIVNLLCLLLDPVYYLQVQKYVSDYDAGVFDQVRESSDNRLRYWVYKANADELLVSLGVFGRGGGAEDRQVHTVCEPAARAAGRAKTYYGFAKSYCELLAGSTGGVADVLGKLAIGFEKYVRILDFMRGEYFNIIDTLSEGELFHLHREIDQVKEKEYVKKKYDELLDLYLEWKISESDDLLAKLKTIAGELKSLDPSFSFEIPDPVRS